MDDEDDDIPSASAEDLYNATLGDLLKSAEENDTDSMCMHGRGSDGTMHWAVIIIRGDCAEELFDGVTQTIDVVAERINKRSLYEPS